MILRKLLKRTLIVSIICLTLLSCSWAESYLTIAQNEASNNGWHNPEISFVSGNYVFNEDAYNTFLLYGLTLRDNDPPKPPLLRWYEVLFVGFVAGYITNDAIR